MTEPGAVTGLRVLPCGDAALLAELGCLDDVLALHAALADDPPPGVEELVPAARTVLLAFDPQVTSAAAVEAAVRATTPRLGRREPGDAVEPVEVEVVYDGADLDEVGRRTGWGARGVVERHVACEWTVAFCGFAPGFGYLTADEGDWDVARRASPRTRVPAGSVALAGAFSAVYPRQSPGGWQLIGRTDLAVFDVDRHPPALLAPGTRVRFVETP